MYNLHKKNSPYSSFTMTQKGQRKVTHKVLYL